MNCDNEGWVYLSRDDGRSWELMDHIAHWPTTMTVDIPAVSDRTVARIVCTDHGGIGGLIASMEYPVGKEVYSTTNVLSAGNWRVTESTDGITFGLIYREKGGWQWYLGGSSSVDPAAWWVWNGHTQNTMTFEFDFGSLDGTKLTLSLSLSLSVHCQHERSWRGLKCICE